MVTGPSQCHRETLGTTTAALPSTAVTCVSLFGVDPGRQPPTEAFPKAPEAEWANQKQLERLRGSWTSEQVVGFLTPAPWRCLPPDQADTPDGPICLEEMRLVLSQMARNKASGSDGLPVEYFTSKVNHLLQPLLRVFNEAYYRVKLPDLMCEVLIVVLPKPGRDPLDVRSYRPLSLLNSDCKVLGNISTTTDPRGSVRVYTR
ncbi:hypothetical protein NDU88_004460 [Pleurodeles waltl]|uniref:Uncharacterized protein n=1 Tax=Pleurodeles waltl TaxID=8319 RepID=A0AAV7T968_PLEWA|nr:hypothetical protein NDU88_004460 [Pleurodeles waltl]